MTMRIVKTYLITIDREAGSTDVLAKYLLDSARKSLMKDVKSRGYYPFNIKDTEWLISPDSLPFYRAVVICHAIYVGKRKALDDGYCKKILTDVIISPTSCIRYR